MSQYRRNSSTWYTADEAGLGTLEGKESFGIEPLAAPVSMETRIGVTNRSSTVSHLPGHPGSMLVRKKGPLGIFTVLNLGRWSHSLLALVLAYTH